MSNSTSWNFYHDSALTNLVEAGDPIFATQISDGSSDPVDVLVYFGSPETEDAFILQATSDPGVDPIIVEIADSGAMTGAPATEFKLALSSGGLTSAVAGDPLELGTELSSGVANAVPVYTRRDSALTAVAAYTDLSLLVAGVFESPAP